jgi:hypothetical protein
MNILYNVMDMLSSSENVKETLCTVWAMCSNAHLKALKAIDILK